MMKPISNLFTIPIDTGRVFGLDILRAFAIFFVVFLHGSLILPQRLANYQFYFIIDGVSIFFVLSGFLIGRIIIKSFSVENISFKSLTKFWMRRWLRTIPNYFAVLILLLGLRSISAESFNGIAFWKYFLFLQNFSTPQPDFFGESWSLSVEEWFYLAIPFIIFLFVASGKLQLKRVVLFVAVIVIIFIITLRWIKFSMLAVNTATDWDLLFRKQVITRLDGIMYGVLGAYFSKFNYQIWFKWRKLFFIGGILVLLLVKISEIQGWYPFLGWYMCVLSYPSTELGILLLLPAMSEWKSGRGLVYRLITYVSMTSYSIYLIHYSIVKTWVVDYMGNIGLHGSLLVMVKYMTYYAMTFLLAVLMYKYFEKPVMELRKNWQ